MKNRGKFEYLITLLFCLCAVQLFSLKNISSDQWKLIYDVWEIFLVWQVVVYSIMSSGKKLFHYEILLLLLIPFFSAIPAYIFHDQDFSDTFLATRSSLLLLFYFYIKKKGVSIEAIESILVYFGVIVASILIIQYFTFPTTYFQQIKDQEVFDERFGVTRVFVQDPIYIVFAMFLLSNRIIKKAAIVDVVLLVTCLVGILFTATRQVIFFSLGVLFLYFLLSMNFRLKKTYKTITIFIAIISVVLYAGGAKFIDKLITMSDEQRSSESTYIRVKEADFFLREYMPSPFAYLIGNGVNYGKSNYGREITKMELEEGYFRSDIGLIGALSMFGLIYILPIALIFYKVFRAKLEQRRYYKFFFLYVLITAFTGANYFYLPWTYTLIFLLLYIIEEETTRSKLNLKVATDKQMAPITL
jgi:hypothetical protein